MSKRQFYLYVLCFIVFAPVTGVAKQDINTARENLGRLLYFDENLSINRNQSCASCHTPPAFVDPANTSDPFNSVVSLGSHRDLNGGRNSPSAGYAAFSPFFYWDELEGLYVGGQFWDGRAANLTEQAKGPFLNPVEMAMPDKRSVLERLTDHRSENRRNYVRLFDQVYDVELDDDDLDNSDVDVVYEMLAESIAAFEKTKTFNKFSSKFDYWIAGHAQLTEIELQGFELFNGKAMCSACHVSDVLVSPDGQITPPLFTDFTYDNIGIPKSTNPLIAGQPIDLGLGGRPDIAATDPDGNELGKHKVMSLRNIAITPPYGHNGFFATLEDIVHFYNTRDDVVSEAWPAPEVPQNVNTDELGDLGLTPEEEAAIVAFMKTLTDGYGDPINNFALPPMP